MDNEQLKIFAEGEYMPEADEPPAEKIIKHRD